MLSPRPSSSASAVTGAAASSGAVWRAGLAVVVACGLAAGTWLAAWPRIPAMLLLGVAAVPAHVLMLMTALRACTGPAAAPAWTVGEKTLSYLAAAAAVDTVLLASGWAVLPAHLWLLPAPARVLYVWWVIRLCHPRGGPAAPPCA